MAVPKSNKVIGKEHHQDSFKNVPTHLLSEILARVASRSFTVLFNAKETCKEFLEAASEDYIFRHINIDSFPVIQWKLSHGTSAFMEKCRKSGNPESLFRQGMRDYFSTLSFDSGVQCLKAATQKGHSAATYVYGIILVCHGGEDRKNGVEVLSAFRSSKSNTVVEECRERVRKGVEFMWLNNFMNGAVGEEEFRRKIRNCKCRKGLGNDDFYRNTRGWNDHEEFDDGFSCDFCLWDIEATRFCNMLTCGVFHCPYLY